MLNAFRTHSSFCAAPLEVLAQTLLYENYRCFHRGPKFQRRYTEIMRLFPTSRHFSCSLLHTTCTNFEAIHHVHGGFSSRGSSIFGSSRPRPASFLQMYDETLLLSLLPRALSSMFVTLIAFLLRAHVNSLLFYEMQTFVYLGQFEIN